jgi:hypothetical protein
LKRVRTSRSPDIGCTAAHGAAAVSRGIDDPGGSGQRSQKTPFLALFDLALSDLALPENLPSENLTLSPPPAIAQHFAIGPAPR